jgi:hypothetical protein
MTINKILPIILLIIILSACSDTRWQRERMSCAASLMESNPDSALKILDSVRSRISNLPRNLRMKYELLYACAQNKAYVTFTSDSVMKEVTDYYDSHGTANEQIEAHYLLGCVYRDMKDAPMALQCYHDAANKADTTSNDCDYFLLGRVHSQIFDLFISQETYPLALDEMDKIINCAWRAHDPELAINCYEQKAYIYHNMKMLDSTLRISLTASSLYEKYKFKWQSAGSLYGAIEVSVERGDYKHAKLYLDKYESQSGFFDGNNIKTGKEGYYYYKGLYCLGTGKLDSAEYYLRKELKYGKDYNNQQFAIKGLFKLYNKLGIKDSISKYALLLTNVTESLYANLSTKNLQQMQSLYNYNRNQRIAQIKTRDAATFRFWLVLFIGAFIILTLSIYIIYNRVKCRIKVILEENAYNIETLKQKELELNELKIQNHASQDSTYLLQKEIENIKNQNKENRSSLSEKESELKMKHEELRRNNEMIKIKSNEIETLQRKIARLQEDNKKPNEWKLEGILMNAPIVMTLHKYGAKGIAASDDEFKELTDLMENYSKGFMDALEIDKNNINRTELRICLLIKLRFVPLEVSNIMDLTRQNVTNIRTRLLDRIFKKKGGAREFDYQIRCLE